MDAQAKTRRACSRIYGGRRDSVARLYRELRKRWERWEERNLVQSLLGFALLFRNWDRAM